MKNKFLCTVLAFVFVIIIGNFTYAASAKINANKTEVTVGDKVTITVTINAAAWNVKPSGAISGSVLAGFNMDGINETTTKTYSLDTSKAGTYTASITGDVTDANETTVNVNSSITITVKEKPVNNTGTNNGTGSSNTTVVEKSTDAYLKALKVNIEGLNPTFNKNTYTYKLSVGSDVSSLKVTASANHSKAKVKITGNTNLKYGDNTVTITVTAEKGNTKTYKIIVTKADDPEKANAYLTNIVIDNAELKNEFSRENTEYAVKDVTFDVKSLMLSAFPENSKASVKIEGNDELKVGENTIKIIVTAEDKKTTREYVLKVNRQEEPAKETVSDNVVIEQNNMQSENINNVAQKIKTNTQSQLLIYIYIFSLVEFFEIIYLFFQLREKDKKENFNEFVVPKYRRKNDKKDKDGE